MIRGSIQFLFAYIHVSIYKKYYKLNIVQKVTLSFSEENCKFLMIWNFISTLYSKLLKLYVFCLFLDASDSDMTNGVLNLDLERYYIEYS